MSKGKNVESYCLGGVSNFNQVVDWVWGLNEWDYGIKVIVSHSGVAFVFFQAKF